MSSVQVFPPFQVYTDRNGEPLEAGFIYIGEANLNPEVHPIQVFFDVGLTIPAAQPIRTIAGYPSYNGTPAKLFASETVYSITVRDKNGVFVYSSLNSQSSTELESDLGNPSPSTGAAMIARGAQVARTIAELRALLKTSASKTAIVLGYYAEGDGGGGIYYLDEFDTLSADNGGTLIVASDGGRWKLQYFDTVTVKQFGAKGDGVTDDTIALQSARDWMAGMTFHPKLTFPAGAYLYSVSPNWAIQDAEIVADGEVRLRYTGVGNAVILDAGSPSGNAYNVKMGHFIVEAPSTALNGVYVRSVHHSDLGFRVLTAGSTSAGIQIEFAVVTVFRIPSTTGNVAGFYGTQQPKYGLFCTRRGVGETTSYCQFENPIFEVVDIGVHMDWTLGNTFQGGTFEACVTRGMETTANSLRDVYDKVDFEANGVRDIVCLGRQEEFRSCDTTLSIFLGGSNNRVMFGNHETIEIDPSGLCNSLLNLLYRRNDTGSLIDGGQQTNMRDLVRVDVGGATLTRHNSVPNRLTPAVGASPFTYTNDTGNDLALSVTGGTVSLLSISRPGFSGTSTGFIAGTVIISPKESLVITHTGAPSLVVRTM